MQFNLTSDSTLCADQSNDLYEFLKNYSFYFKLTFVNYSKVWIFCLLDVFAKKF